MVFEEENSHINLKEVVKRIVTKTDRENKILLGSSKFYFIFDPIPGFAESLRFCNPDICIVAVATSPQNFDQFSLANFDCLITGRKLTKNSDIKSVRKVEYFRNPSDIPLLIRKIVQEFHSREYEVLLPIVGFDGFHQKELISFDTIKFDGLIKVKKGFKFSSDKNSLDQYSEFVKNITDLAVNEQIFYTYSNLLNQEKGLELKQFFNFSLLDGRRFYVRS